ncbi:uncharacterized protein J4E88_005326 [Alternaria novae-zelandiae]|uniref:uncharacterized protein n=1 Tax=Alternaria novae-zelandiae TaxID=430562 RepID=UPI0020C402BC|nr:uncharacterized protein J4E88_005326 [Alternaria novae-zelandiae]KAI4682436.1 hypothetical protein J4E88_005326 [Alternaria novae-zelandiae]
MAPSALTSQGSPSIPEPAKPQQPTPETSQEATSPTVSLSEENFALKQRLAHSELAKKHLVEEVADGKQRVIDAAKRATAAEIETKAAKARAQNRYTEKVHANNENRHLKKRIDTMDKERADFIVGVNSILQGRDEMIAKLEEEKASGECSKEELIEKFTKQVDGFQQRYLASERGKEKEKREKELEKKVSDKIIGQLKSDRDTQGNVNKDLKSVIAQLRQEIATEKEKSKAAADASTMDQIEARVAAAKADGFKEATIAKQSENAEYRKTIEEKATAHVAWIKKGVETKAKEYVQKRETEWRSEQTSLIQRASAAEAALSAANTKLSIAQQRPIAASVSQPVPNDAQRPPKRSQPTSSQGAFDSNKRRRLNETGAAGITTPDFLRTHSNSLPSDTNAMSPLSTTWSNGDTIMGDTQMQRQARHVAPNGMHGRSSSQQSTGSAGQMAPARRPSQQPGAMVAAPPGRTSSNMSPQQQRHLMQNLAAGNAGSQSPRFPQHNLGLMRTSPQVGRQMGSGQQMTNQAGNMNSYDGDLMLQQMQRDAQSQIRSQMSTPAHGSMRRTLSYGSASSVAPPQPHVAQHSSNQFAPPTGQDWSMRQNFEPQNLSTNGTNQRVAGNYAPIMEELDSNFAFDVDALTGDVGASYAGPLPVLEDTHDGNDWFPTEHNNTQTAFNSTLFSNGTPPMSQTDFQQPQQRSYQTHSRNHSQPYEGSSRDMSHGSKSLQNEPTMNMSRNGSRQPSVSGRATRASSRSTPGPSGPSGRSRRKTPGLGEPTQVPCVNCYRHWWEGECDEGEPCSNCAASGTKCVRQKCINYAAGTCDKGIKCPNVHEGDERYQNEEFLVAQTKAGKRPSRLGTRAEAKPAPTQD